MRILFDQGTPVAIGDALQNHSVRTANAQGWSTLTNGELLRVAEEAGFDVLLTTEVRVPLGTEHSSPARKRWVADGPSGEPRRGGTNLIQQVSRIVFKAMPPQKVCGNVSPLTLPGRRVSAPAGRLRGLMLSHQGFPGLPPWANFCRP